MATATDARVADLVRAAADDHGFTQVTLAGRLGITRQALSARLCGRTRWTLSEVSTLAQLLDLDVHALLDATSDGGEVTAA